MKIVITGKWAGCNLVLFDPFSDGKESELFYPDLIERVRGCDTAKPLTPNFSSMQVADFPSEWREHSLRNRESHDSGRIFFFYGDTGSNAGIEVFGEYVGGIWHNGVEDLCVRPFKLGDKLILQQRE